MELKILNLEIFTINNLIQSNYNLWRWERLYLNYKLFDLIHSYLLELNKRHKLYNMEGVEVEQVQENLNKSNYSIQDNINLIPSLQITAKENINYWYDTPNNKKIDAVLKEIQ